MPDNSSIGKVQLDLETNAAPFQQQLQGIAGKSTSMITSAFGKLGKVMAGAFAVKKLVSFGKAAIDLASDLDEVQNVVDVVFGESSSQINNFAKTALNAYGLSELSAKQYASTMGAMLKSMGLSSQATLDMSQSITALAGDMASFYNLDSDSAFQKIRAGISGETEPLKQLGINMSQANLQAFALSQGITKSVQSMTQSEQALLRYNYLLNTTKDAQGDFARTSDSWANQTRILSEQWKSFQGTMGSAFITVLTPVIKVVNQLISKLQLAANYFKAFVEAITGTKAETDTATSGMGAMADSATEAGDATVEAAEKAKKALAGFDQLNVLSSGDDSSSSSGSGGDSLGLGIPSLADATVALPEPDVSGVESAINKVKSMFADLKKYFTTSFAPSLRSWGGAFSNLKQPISEAVQSISNSVQGLWEGTLAPLGQYLLEDFAPSMINTFSETLAPIFSDVMGASIREMATQFEWSCAKISALTNDVLFPVLEFIKTAFSDVATSISTEWERSGEKLTNLFSGFMESIRGMWDNLYNTVKPLWDSIMEGIDNLWQEHLKPALDPVVQFCSKFVEAILTVWNNALAPLVNWIVSVFGSRLVSQLQTIWGCVMAVVGNLVDAVGNIFAALGGLMDFIIGVFSGDWRKAWEGIKTYFKNVWEATANVLKAPINLIIGIINTLLNSLVIGLNSAIKNLNKMSFEVPNWVPLIGGQKWGFNIKELTAPKIPYLAEGGIINQPTLAMVGEAGKEAVVPLENTAFADSIANAILRVLAPLFSKADSPFSSNDTNGEIVLKVGEYELGRVSVSAINKYHSMVGKIELEV